MLLMKAHLSQCSELLWIWVTYGGDWRCTSGSHWTGGKHSPPPGIQRVDTIIGGAPVGKAQFLSPAFTQCAMKMEGCLPRHRAMPLTAMPGGKGARRRAWALREAAVCCSMTGHDYIINNHTTDGRTTQTHKPAVIPGTKPSVKMVLTVQTAGSHETTHTQRDLI